MGMKIDLNNIETEEEEREYINEEGIYTLKVKKVTFGTTKNNNKTVKVHFVNKRKKYATDEFVITDSALWKLKLFTKALKLPNVIDTNMFIDRYVKATVKAKATQNSGTIYEIKKYEASNLTNTYVAREPRVVYEKHTHTQNHQANKQEFDEDDIPF